MKLVICIVIVHLSGLCQAFNNSSTPTTPTDVQVTGDRKEFNSPLLHHLTACSWTLRMSGNSSSEAVAVPTDSIDQLVQHICQGLDCGEVYDVKETSPAPDTTCFRDCRYGPGGLRSCAPSAGGGCSVITEAVCGRQAVRLSGGTDRCNGRVEVWTPGGWGTVCDDRWDLRDADVVCRQLSCGYALSVTGQGDSFPPGRGAVYLDELNCTGAEENLWACPAARDESDCGHKEDAGVVCSEMRSVRLTGGQDRCSGRVEVHRNGTWGTVCDTCWDRDMASMVCSMLQCGSEPLNYTQFLPPLSHNDGILWYYHCTPDEQDLWQCTEFINKTHLCATSKASAVICNGSLGFASVATTNTTVMTPETTAVQTTAVPAAEGFHLPPPELLASVALSLLLLVFLIINTVLCCHYRRRHAFLIQQACRTKPAPSDRHHKYEEAVSLVKVLSSPQQADAPTNPRYLWTQLSSVDSTSVDTDYEQYDPSNDPSVPLSTFRNSQRYRVDTKPLMRPSGLDSLVEGPERTNEVTVASSNNNGQPADPYARVSKISVDSFESSSTSSDENYENTRNSYVSVAANQCYSYTSDNDEGPVYSPVSPNCEPSEDEYDDIGA